MKIYGIYDKKAGFFLTMFVSENDETAKRDVIQTISSHSNSNLAKFPDDYVLKCLGYYNQRSGDIKKIGLQYVVFELITLFKAPEPDPVEKVSEQEESSEENFESEVDNSGVS